jgi:hypothetical protein
VWRQGPSLETLPDEQTRVWGGRVYQEQNLQPNLHGWILSGDTAVVGREEEGISSLRQELAAIARTLQALSLETDLLYLCDSEAGLIVGCPDG